MTADIAINIAKVRQRIVRAAEKSGRDPSEITLLAVSKTRPASAIAAATAAGITDIGENYLQEALEKMAWLDRPETQWHFFGPVQSNKTRAMAEHFDWVHTVDREKIIQRLAQQRPATLPPLNVCIQVNISAEASKAGCAPEQIDTLASAIADCTGLRLRGLMAIPDADSNPAELTAMAGLFQSLQHRYPGVDTLSMGMSGDLEAAVAAGSTLLRIGTDIFGPRA